MNLTTHKPLLDFLPKLPSNGLRVVSLFAGGGLLDLGAIHAGFDIVQAYEWEIAPTLAYAHNIGDHIVGPRTRAEKKAGVGDITKVALEDIADCDVIIGGPPCQDYSVAGSGAGEAGERGKLVWRYLEIIEAKRPLAFFFENVKGLTTKKHRPTLDALIVKFDETGYNTTWSVVNAWDYGVAQKRERVILVGLRREKPADAAHKSIRRKIKRLLSIPKTKENTKQRLRLMNSLLADGERFGATYEWPRSEYETSGYRPVLRDAIGDLPEPGVAPAMIDRHGNPSQRVEHSGVSSNHTTVENHAPKPLNSVEIAYLDRNPASVAKNRPVTMDEPSRTIPAVMHKGVPYGLFVPELANHGVGDYWTPPNEYEYDQANRVMSMDSPSNTILAHHNVSQPIHPLYAPRRFTIRECLRIQSVPDSYIIPDGISRSSSYKIVGNGVASRMAYTLLGALAGQLLHS